MTGVLTPSVFACGGLVGLGCPLCLAAGLVAGLGWDLGLLLRVMSFG